VHLCLRCVRACVRAWVCVRATRAACVSWRVKRGTRTQHNGGTARDHHAPCAPSHTANSGASSTHGHTLSAVASSGLASVSILTALNGAAACPLVPLPRRMFSRRCTMMVQGPHHLALNTTTSGTVVACVCAQVRTQRQGCWCMCAWVGGGAAHGPAMHAAQPDSPRTCLCLQHLPQLRLADGHELPLRLLRAACGAAKRIDHAPRRPA
jgi:hypothetical protein